MDVVFVINIDYYKSIVVLKVLISPITDNNSKDLKN